MELRHVLFAYLDPDTGSIGLQAILATIAAALVLLKMNWSRVKGWMSRRSSGSDGD